MKERTDKMDFIKIKNIYIAQFQENEKTSHKLG